MLKLILFLEAVVRSIICTYCKVTGGISCYGLILWHFNVF
jgi:hypothetical protein